MLFVSKRSRTFSESLRGTSKFQRIKRRQLLKKGGGLSLERGRRVPRKALLTPRTQTVPISFPWIFQRSTRSSRKLDSKHDAKTGVCAAAISSWISKHRHLKPLSPSLSLFLPTQHNSDRETCAFVPTPPPHRSIDRSRSATQRHLKPQQQRETRASFSSLAVAPTTRSLSALHCSRRCMLARTHQKGPAMHARKVQRTLSESNPLSSAGELLASPSSAGVLSEQQLAAAGVMDAALLLREFG